jgi:hypothetical protein
MTSWITLAVGALLVGLLIGRTAIGSARRGARSPGQETHRMRALQGWVLLAYGAFIALAAIVSAHSRIVNIVLAAVSIPLAIGILINDRRSSANQRQH